MFVGIVTIFRELRTSNTAPMPPAASDRRAYDWLAFCALWRRRLAAEGGFTLIELLVASALSVVVLGATFAALESTQRVQARDSEYALTIQEARTGLARMTREIRQAYNVKGATPDSIDFLATFAGKTLEIYYQCDVKQTGTEYDQCVRLAATPPASLPALSTGAPIVKDLLNNTARDPSDPVFSYSPNAIEPSFATLKIVVPAAGTLKETAGNKGYVHSVVLYNGAYIRAMNLGG